MQEPVEWHSVAIVGMGTMGRKIIELCLVKELSVLAVARTPESGLKSLDRIKGDLHRGVEKGRITPDKMDSMLENIKLISDMSELRNIDLVIEAVSEDLSVKKNVYSGIERFLREDTLIATNTSSLSVTELSSDLVDQTRFVGLHFFNPPEMMKLVEVRGGPRTSERTLQLSCDFAKRLGKTAIRVPDVPGYYVNRILFPMLIESMYVLETSKANPKDIDDAIKLGANHPMGPLELCDFIGNDVVLDICEILFERTRDKRYEPPAILRKMVTEGRLGRKSAKGFYDY